MITAQTADKREPSIYDSNLTEDAIRDMEMSCIPVGTEDPEGVELPRKLPHVRRFYRAFDNRIGASQGQQTNYILVQWNRDGSVHGYPVTAEYLKSKGADL